MNSLRETIAKAILEADNRDWAGWPHNDEQPRGAAWRYADAVLSALEAWEPSEAVRRAGRLAAESKTDGTALSVWRAMWAAIREGK